jgi:hypothetical protein
MIHQGLQDERRRACEEKADPDRGNFPVRQQHGEPSSQADGNGHRSALSRT